MPVCITGMHRSGTSMVARLLHLSGLYLGEAEALMPASPDNPDGYWEHIRLHQWNDALLHTLGGGWDAPPFLANGWLQNSGMPILQTQGESILMEFAGHEAWGWKDPSNSLTLPFWQQLIPDLKVVVCVRNPLEVALSLTKRNGFSYEHGLRLWLTYNQRILETTNPANRIVTHYEQYFSDPENELRRVLAFLGLPNAGDIIAHACGAVATGLHHNRFAADDLQRANLSSAMLDLYARLQSEAGILIGLHECTAHAVHQSDHAADRAQQASREAISLATIDEQEERSMRETEGTATATGGLNQAVLDAELLRQANANLGQLTERYRELEQMIAERDGIIALLREQVGQPGQVALTDVASLQRTIDEQQRHIEALRQQADTRTRRETILQERLVALHAQLGQRDQALMQVHSLQEQLEYARREIDAIYATRAMRMVERFRRVKRIVTRARR